MPPRYPRERPALETASPADSAPGRDHDWRDGFNHRWLMLFGDGEEHPVTVRAWWTDDRGREIVQVEFWDAERMTTRGGAYLFDPAKAREGLGPPSRPPLAFWGHPGDDIASERPGTHGNASERAAATLASEIAACSPATTCRDFFADRLVLPKAVGISRTTVPPQFRAGIGRDGKHRFIACW